MLELIAIFLALAFVIYIVIPIVLVVIAIVLLVFIFNWCSENFSEEEKQGFSVCLLVIGGIGGVGVVLVAALRGIVNIYESLTAEHVEQGVYGAIGLVLLGCVVTALVHLLQWLDRVVEGWRGARRQDAIYQQERSLHQTKLTEIERRKNKEIAESRRYYERKNKEMVLEARRRTTDAVLLQKNEAKIRQHNLDLFRQRCEELHDQYAAVAAKLKVCAIGVEMKRV